MASNNHPSAERQDPATRDVEHLASQFSAATWRAPRVQYARALAKQGLLAEVGVHADQDPMLTREFMKPRYHLPEQYGVVPWEKIGHVSCRDLEPRFIGDMSDQLLSRLGERFLLLRITNSDVRTPEVSQGIKASVAKLGVGAVGYTLATVGVYDRYQAFQAPSTPEQDNARAMTARENCAQKASDIYQMELSKSLTAIAKGQNVPDFTKTSVEMGRAIEVCVPAEVQNIGAQAYERQIVGLASGVTLSIAMAGLSAYWAMRVCKKHKQKKALDENAAVIAISSALVKQECSDREKTGRKIEIVEPYHNLPG